MKRLWVGILVLAVFLAASLLLSWYLPQLHRALSDDLSAAAQAAEKSDWEEATRLAGGAKQRWERNRHFVASFTDHEPLENLDSLFEELEVYRTAALPVDYAATCIHLSQLCLAIAESHCLTWWNLL